MRRRRLDQWDGKPRQPRTCSCKPKFCRTREHEAHSSEPRSMAPRFHSTKQRTRCTANRRVRSLPPRHSRCNSFRRFERRGADAALADSTHCGAVSRSCATRATLSRSRRQELGVASRRLMDSLDDQWEKCLALSAEVWIPNHMPSINAIQKAIARYEIVSRQPQCAALTNLPAFQTTLKVLWRLGELQQGK